MISGHTAVFHLYLNLLLVNVTKTITGCLQLLELLEIFWNLISAGGNVFAGAATTVSSCHEYFTPVHLLGK